MDKSRQYPDPIEAMEELNRLHPGIPVVWYDRQGFDLCMALRSEFPHCNVFHRGLAFMLDKQWRRGTRLSFYSSLDQENQIANRVRQLVESNAYYPVLLEFFKIEDQHRGGATPFATIQLGEGEAADLP